MVQPYPAYKDSGLDWLGEIPCHWERKAIRAITQVKTERNQPDLPLLSVYRDYGVIYKDSRDDNYNRAGMDLSNYKVVAPNDLVINKMKTWQGSLGVSQYEGIVSPAYIVCELDGSISGKYLNFLLRCRPYVYAYSRISYGVRVDQWDMRYEDFKQIPVFLPPQAEQDAIVAFLEEQTAVIDQFISNKRRLIALLEEQKQVVINTAVTHGLDPNAPHKSSGVDWLGDIPAHWIVKKFKYCALIRGGQIDPREEPYRSMILVAPNHIEQGTGKLLYTETADEQGADSGKYLCDSGDVLYSKIRPNLRKACIAPNRCLCSADMYAIAPNSLLLPKFLLYILVCDGFTQMTVVESMRVAMPKVNREALNNMTIAYPKLDEQEEIVEFIEKQSAEIDTAIERAQREIDLIEEYCTTLVAHAVTGKIDVRSTL